MNKISDEHAMVSYINMQRRTNYKEYQNCLFAYFLSQKEPKKVIQALADPSWVEAIQEELLQFKLQKVWTLVNLPTKKREIGTKWVFRNKKDERGIIVRNKARLFAQCYTQEEGINYDEMDVKSAFLYGTIEEEVYVCQPPGFEDPHFLDKVYKKEDGIFISQDKYVAEILKNFDFATVKTASTPIETNKALILESEFAGAQSGRKSTTRGCQFLSKRLISWQCKKQTIVANSTTKVEYVDAANCCGQMLWIQNQMLDYGFNFINTKIYIDNESTICIVKNPVFHFKTKHIEIRHHLIRDSYEKRLIQVLKIYTEYNVADLLTKGFDVSRLFGLYSGRIGLNMGKKLVSAARLALCCWAKVSTVRHRVSAARQTIGSKEVLLLSNWLIPFNDIPENTLKLTKSSSGEGSEKTLNPTLPSTAPHKSSYLKLLIMLHHNHQRPKTQIGETKEGRNTKVPQCGGSHNKVGDEAINEEMLHSVERAATTATSLGAEQASGNIHKTQFMATLNEPSSLELGSGGHTLGSGEDSMEHQIELTDNVPNTPHDSPLPGGYTPQSDEDSLEQNKLMDLVTKLSHRVLDLEKVKTAQAKEIASLKRRVTKLEQRQRSRILKNHPFRFGSSKNGFCQEKDAEKRTKEDVFDDTARDAQIERDDEVALILQAELDEELKVERERQEEASKVAIAEMFDEVQARMDADYELAARMTQEEQEKYKLEEKARYQKVMKSAKDVTEEEAAEYEKEKEELRLSLKIIPNERQADGSSSYHGDTQAFLRRFDRQDLNDLYRLAQERFQDHPLEGHDFCGVHTLFMDGTPMEINMLVEKKYPLIKELMEKMLNLQLEAEEESTMAFELIKFIKSLLEE
ncbi:putative ribonuclease H-like domain-containing protein [Tanacetum coccineum]